MCGGGDGEIKETAHEKELARIATEQWERFETELKPFEDEMIAKIGQNMPAAQENIRGRVASQVGSQYDEAQSKSDEAALARGTDVSSGTFKRSLSRGDAVGKGMATGNMLVNQKEVSDLSNAISMGRGQAAQAQSSITELAGDATNKAINDSTLDYRDRKDTSVALGTGAGMLTRGLKKEK